MYVHVFLIISYLLKYEEIDSKGCMIASFFEMFILCTSVTKKQIFYDACKYDYNFWLPYANENLYHDLSANLCLLGLFKNIAAPYRILQKCTISEGHERHPLIFLKSLSNLAANSLLLEWGCPLPCPTPCRIFWCSCFL